MGQRIIRISAELLHSWFMEDGGVFGPCRVIKDGLPADAKLVNAGYIWPNLIETTWESPSWLPESGPIQQICPMFETVKGSRA